MPTLGEFSAWIAVDGKALPEFSPRISENGKEIICWIPSEANKEFAVCWKAARLTYTIDGTVTIDGIECGGLYEVFKKRTKRNVLFELDLVQTSKSSARPFLFSKIESTDDETYLRQKVPRQLGQIRIVVSRARVDNPDSRPYEKPRRERKPRLLPETMTLHERLKTGLGHRVGLGMPIKVKGAKTCGVDSIEPVATFIFQYRSWDMLQANGLAPPPPSIKKAGKKRKASSPLTDIKEDESEDEMDAEIAALQIKLRELEKRKKKRMKTEVTTGDRDTIPVKTLDVIDLTHLD
ncbi:hypothetical protein BDN72DRAFT_897079 [Pluteus cervinus]|uniref:Uncharacterized protein n=1 Tax=Pluteus cervinus TaxID=181527 RepID=A0ACD3AWG0_9AGAR|nr:hypothetical protein BDN72DRAFT_897079 [Pluteus cervinus]